MLSIGTTVWFSVTAPDGAIHATGGTVVRVPSRASGTYTVMSDDQVVFQQYHELTIAELNVIPRRSLRIECREGIEAYRRAPSPEY